MQGSKELLKNAFMEAEKTVYSEYKSEDRIEYDFSEQFEREMNKLIAKDNRIKLYTRRRISAALIAALIAVIIMFTGLMSVSATRKAFFEIIEKFGTENVQIILSGESTPPVDRIETAYTLSEVPEGFELSILQLEETSVFIVWKNEAGEEISFMQGLLDGDRTIDTEHGFEMLSINGYNAYLTVYDYQTIIVWTDGKYWLSLSVPFSSKEYILELVNNISEIN